MLVLKIEKDKGIQEKSKRLGRGTGNGRGRYCGKGCKGQKARKGCAIGPAFEGGQMPLYRRIPKRGFKNINKLYFNIINISTLNHYKDGEIITIDLLKSQGLIKSNNSPVKLLGNGDLTVKNLSITVNAASKKAIEKINEAKGKVEII